MAENNNINYDILDQDTLSSDSATSLATQQSLKAYADTQLPKESYHHLSTQTASNVSSIDFTGLDSTYQIYILQYYNMVPVTDNIVAFIRVGTGGTPTYQATGYKFANFEVNTAGTGTPNGSTSTTQVSLNTTGNLTTENQSGEIVIFNPSSATIYKDIMHKLSYVDSAGTFFRHWGSGQYTSATAVTAIRFAFSSGNISVGTFKLYGLRSS